MKSFRDRLLLGESRLCVMGLGYIGYSALVYYAHKGVKCIGFDINPTVIKRVKDDQCPAPGMDVWLQANGMKLDVSVDAISGKEELWKFKDDICVYKVCIPTEENGQVSDRFLAETCRTIAALTEGVQHRVLVDIESTIAPNMVDKVAVPAFRGNPRILISVSPRRDWFISSEKDLRRIPRIVGGSTPEAGEAAQQVNSIVCDDVIVASDHRVASASKAVENTLRNVSINVVNEMARNFDFDVREVCRLVATKWNVGHYEPSIGIGGYCIPLGPGYLISGNDGSQPLSILKTAIEETSKHVEWVAERLMKNGYKTAAFLGLSYRGDVPVYKVSPAIEIAKFMMAKGMNVIVSDLYMSEQQKKDFFTTPIDFRPFPECLKGAEFVLIGSGHTDYRSLPIPRLLENLKTCKVILDNEGVYSHVPAHVWKEAGIRYVRPGEYNWLGSPESWG